MKSTAPLAEPGDVEDLWRPLTADETVRVARLIDKASANLRQACPFDIDERTDLFEDDPDNAQALDPLTVASVVATKVKNYLVNPDGVATGSESIGPFAHSATYVNRYDKTGSDVRGSLQFTESDIDQLRPAVPAATASSFRYRVPRPQLLIPAGRVRGRYGRGVGPVVVPDYAPGSGVE